MSALSNFKRVQQWETFTPRWLFYDTRWQNPFQSAKMISDVLQGEHKLICSPTSDCRDHVVVMNCSEIAMSWYEWKYRMYFHDTRIAGGRSWTPAWQVQDKDATKVLWKAVYRALPGDLNRQIRIARLHLFPDDKVPREIMDNISGQLRQLRRAPVWVN
nr:39S ribosomal protein L13, mitochondrial-like [Rhipicephalus microplus]